MLSITCREATADAGPKGFWVMFLTYVPPTDASPSQPMCVVGIRCPLASLQIVVLMVPAMFWILVAVPARDGGHAYPGGNFVLYLSTRVCVNQLRSSYVRK